MVEMDKALLLLNTLISGLALAAVFYLITKRKESPAVEVLHQLQPVNEEAYSGRSLEVAILLRKLEWYFLETTRFVQAMENLHAQGGQSFIFSEYLLTYAIFSEYERQILASMNTRHPIPVLVRLEDTVDEIAVIFNEDTRGTLHEAAETALEPSFYSRVRRLRGKLKFAIFFLRREFEMLEGKALKTQVGI